MAETIFEEGIDGFHSEQNWQDVKWLPEKEQVTKLNSDAVVDAQCALKVQNKTAESIPTGGGVRIWDPSIGIPACCH